MVDIYAKIDYHWEMPKWTTRWYVWSDENIPLPIMTEAEKAYTAGLYDGEGSKSSIQVGNSNLEAVKWLQVKFGGRVSAYMLPTGKPFYMWFLPVAKKKRFLDAVRPYLIIKKREPLFTVAA